jgi:hypothetical protein
MAALAAELPESTSKTRRPICAGVQFSAADPHHVSQARVSGLVPKGYRTRRRIIAGAQSFRRLSAHVFEDMGLQPFPVPEKGAKRQGDLPMLVAFGPGRERAGVSQYVAPVFDEFGLAVERLIQHQCASYRRHDATYVDTQSP